MRFNSNTKKKKIRLITILYVSNFKINFLLIKRLCEMKFEKNFNENEFYMRNKKKRLMLKIFVFNDVYIINKITKKLNEIVFIAIIIDNVKNVFVVLLFTKIKSKIEFINSNNLAFLKFEINDF